MSQSQLALLIPILVPLALFALIFGIIYLRNKERMAMIERGMEPDNRSPRQRQSNPAFSLTFGLLLIGSGFGLFIAYLMDYFAFRMDSNPAIYFSMIAFFGGL